MNIFDMRGIPSRPLCALGQFPDQHARRRRSPPFAAIQNPRLASAGIAVQFFSHGRPPSSAGIQGKLLKRFVVLALLLCLAKIASEKRDLRATSDNLAKHYFDAWPTYGKFAFDFRLDKRIGCLPDGRISLRS